MSYAGRAEEVWVDIPLEHTSKRPAKRTSANCHRTHDLVFIYNLQTFRSVCYIGRCQPNSSSSRAFPERSRKGYELIEMMQTLSMYPAENFESHSIRILSQFQATILEKCDIRSFLVNASVSEPGGSRKRDGVSPVNCLKSRIKWA